MVINKNSNDKFRMNTKSLLLLYGFLLVILYIGIASSASCIVTTPNNCQGANQKVVMRLSDTTNAHGALATQTSFPYVLCCDFGAGGTTCSSIDPVTGQPDNKLIGLSSFSNAHGEIPDLVSPNYNTYNACYDSLKDCSSVNSTYNCGSGEIINLSLSLSSNTDAHLEATSSVSYNTKFCCTVALPSPYQCNDSIDNDGNGCSDFPSDSGCSSATDNSEAGGTCTNTCTLNSASWESGVTQRVAGQSVTLNVDTSNCVGQQISFEIKERDTVGGDDPVQINPANAIVDANGNAIATWVAEWQAEGWPETNPPEYYFKATVVGNLAQTIQSSNELSVFQTIDCTGVTTCSSYTNQTDCGNDLCAVASNSVPKTIDCSDPNKDCFCAWNTNINQCEGAWKNKPINPKCGDGVINTGETCDGNNWGPITGCSNFDNFTGGTLGCYSNTSANPCQFDTGSCTRPPVTTPYCGDSSVDRPNTAGLNEQCDPDVGTSVFLSTENSCVKLTQNLGMDSYTGGILGCNGLCAFDITQCTSPPGTPKFCGDNVVNQLNETCDGNDHRGNTCNSLGYSGGTLGCYSNTSANPCQFDKSSCTIPPPGTSYCGDGNIDQPNSANRNEYCDPDTSTPNMTITTCSGLNSSVYQSGNLGCASDCTYNLGQCVLKPGVTESCGDNVLNQLTEECDGGFYSGGNTCESLGFSGGTLSCSGCKIDSSQCIVPPPITATDGTCYYNEQSTDTCEDDGYLTVNLTATWVLSDGSLGSNPECQSTTETIQCPSEIPLPFFTIYNLLAAIVVIALIYWMIDIRRKGKKKEGKR
jgi:hypothetical protein